MVFSENPNIQINIWRSNTNEQIKHFDFKVLTYGLAPHSLLAITSIKEAVHDNVKNTIILLEDLYVDYLLSSLSTLIEAVETCYKITNILHTHGLHLKMWNSREFLESQDYPTTEINSQIILTQNETFKVLDIKLKFVQIHLFSRFP